MKRLRPQASGHVAIGGITINNVDELLAAGAKAIAVSSAVINSPDPAKVCIS